MNEECERHEHKDVVWEDDWHGEIDGLITYIPGHAHCRACNERLDAEELCRVIFWLESKVVWYQKLASVTVPQEKTNG
jgi:hypothetical protein